MPRGSREELPPRSWQNDRVTHIGSAILDPTTDCNSGSLMNDPILNTGECRHLSDPQSVDQPARSGRSLSGDSRLALALRGSHLTGSLRTKGPTE